ncbi:MAG TPA: amidase family protein, partial [Vicinamibacterales bacterium]|nr:amidase family protein [Vicinamibacterales bacterium]
AAFVLLPRRGGSYPPDAVDPRARPRPVLAIPVGPYLDRASPDAAVVFDRVSAAIAAAGIDVCRVPVMADFDRIRERHEVILAAEAAHVHASWFHDYETLYSSKMADLVRRGQAVAPSSLDRARDEQAAFRRELQDLMVDRGIDAWICPSTVGPAPRGLDSTGDPVMNLPWTQAGLPVVGLPAGTQDGLPLGLQVVGRWGEDEALLARAEALETIIAR